jgi:orotate phosphoribosyltransferase
MADMKPFLLQLIKDRALGFGEITLSSGKKSNYYVDGRLVTLSADGAYAVGKALYDELQGEQIDAIGGPTMGADPIAASVALISHLEGKPIQAFIVRKEPKKHGKGRWIEGPALAEGARVVIVDDTATTGASLVKAAAAVEEAGAKIVRIITIVDREEGAREVLEEKGYRFTPLFTAKDLGVKPIEG